MKLQVEDLKKSFPEFSYSASFQADLGSFITILGPSGSGKSTSLQLISGLLEPESGEIFLGNSRLSEIPPWEREIGFVFQDYALFPHMSVFDNVAYGLRLKRKRKKHSETAIEQKVLEMLELTGLKEYRDRMPATLSGGERQRVALARALAPDPKLLLFDEPLSALDAPLRSKLREEIRDLQKSLGLTTIYVTHDRDEALSMSDHIVIMREGSVVECGAPRQLYERPASLFGARFLGECSLFPDGRGRYFRPEHGILKGEESREAVEVRLKSIDYYGAWSRARLFSKEGTELSVRLDSEKGRSVLRKNGKIYLQVDEDKLLDLV